MLGPPWGPPLTWWAWLPHSLVQLLLLLEVYPFLFCSFSIAMRGKRKNRCSIGNFLFQCSAHHTPFAVQNKIWVLISYAVVFCVCPFFLFALKCRLLWLCHIQWFGSYACVAMHIVAEWEYLLGTMSTGIPRECLINVWLGILHRLVHIPTQFVSSKNLQGEGLMAKIPSAIKTLMMIWKWWWLLPLWWSWWKWRRREPWSIKLIGADWFTK